MRPGTRRGGFTLVEVLLTLGILATILVLLLASFVGAERGLDILSSRSRMFRQIRIAMDRIGTDLEGAFASTSYEASALTCRSDQFSGKPASTLVFSAFVLPETGGPRPPADLVKIRYYPKVSADGSSIDLYREQADLPLLQNRLVPTESRLATRLQGFRAEFFDGTNWSREWPAGGSGKQSLPKKVMFILVDDLGQEYRRTLALPLAGQEAQTTYSGKRKPENR